jgi:3-dehydroquinate dehydratase-1
VGVTIGTVELGEIPRVVLVLSDRNLKDALSLARHLRLDLVELRVDLFADCKGLEAIRSCLDTIAEFGFYSILTIRPGWEGGRFTEEESVRLQLFKALISHPGVGSVDIELKAQILPAVREIAKAHRKPLIVSYHNFENVPPQSQILEILEKAKNLGADIVKVAFTAKDLESAQRLCCAVSVFKHPKVFMAMGSAGMFTRVVGFSFGSLLTYTFFGKPTAPGQVPAEKLVKLLHGLYPDYHARKAGCFVG